MFRHLISTINLCPGNHWIRFGIHRCRICEFIRWPIFKLRLHTECKSKTILLTNLRYYYINKNKNYLFAKMNEQNWNRHVKRPTTYFFFLDAIVSMMLMPSTGFIHSMWNISEYIRSETTYLTPHILFHVAPPQAWNFTDIWLDSKRIPPCFVFISNTDSLRQSVLQHQQVCPTPKPKPKYIYVHVKYDRISTVDRNLLWIPW